MYIVYLLIILFVLFCRFIYVGRKFEVWFIGRYLYKILRRNIYGYS